MKGKHGYRRFSQHYITDRLIIYKALSYTTAEHTFYYSACGTISRIDHMLQPKANLNKF